MQKKVYGVTYSVFGTVTVDIVSTSEEKAEDVTESMVDDMDFGDLENIAVEWSQTDEWESEDPETFNTCRWSVRGYNKDGSLKEEKVLGSELDCAKYCVAQLRMGYPAPTVWHFGSRVEGY